MADRKCSRKPDPRRVPSSMEGPSVEGPSVEGPSVEGPSVGGGVCGRASCLDPERLYRGLMRLRVIKRDSLTNYPFGSSPNYPFGSSRNYPFGSSFVSFALFFTV